MLRAVSLSRGSESEAEPEACRYRIQEPVPLQEARVRRRAARSRDGLAAEAAEDLVDRIAG